MIAGTVPQAHNVNMRFHQPGHNRAAAQIDNAHAGSGLRGRTAHAHDAVVANGDRVYHSVGCIHRVDLAVDQSGRGLVQNAQCRSLPA